MPALLPMKPNRIGLLILLLLLATFSANGQQLYKEGFILNSPLDTVKGKIKYISYNQAAENCIFKTEEGEETQYKPGDIYGFGIGKDLFFVSKKVEGEPDRFLEVLYQGSTILYSYRDTNSRNYFFLESKDTGKFGALTQKVIGTRNRRRVIRTYMDVLKLLLPESELVAEEIENTSLTARSLVRLLVAYDQRYANTQGIVYNGGSKKTPPKFGVLVGQGVGIFTLNGHKRSAVDRINSVGIRMQKEVSRGTGRLFIDVDLILSREDYSKTFEASQNVGNNDIVSNFVNIQASSSFLGITGAIDYRTTVDLNRTVLTMPIELKYKFPGRKLNFTLGGGFSFQYAASKGGFVVGQIFQESEVAPFLEVVTIEDSNPFRWGMNFGFGVSYNAKRTIFLDLRHSPAWLDLGVYNFSYFRANLGMMLSKNK